MQDWVWLMFFLMFIYSPQQLLITSHIQGYTPEEIAIRVEVVDRVNAETARRSAIKYASQKVTSAGASPAPA
jgi:RPA family protein